MTSLAPISSENPSSVAHQNQRISILVIMYNAESRQHMDGGDKKLRRIGNFKKIGFQTIYLQPYHTTSHVPPDNLS